MKGHKMNYEETQNTLFKLYNDYNLDMIPIERMDRFIDKILPNFVALDDWENFCHKMSEDQVWQENGICASYEEWDAKYWEARSQIEAQYYPSENEYQGMYLIFSVN